MKSADKQLGFDVIQMPKFLDICPTADRGCNGLPALWCPPPGHLGVWGNVRRFRLEHEIPRLFSVASDLRESLLLFGSAKCHAVPKGVFHWLCASVAVASKWPVCPYGISLVLFRKLWSKKKLFASRPFDFYPCVMQGAILCPVLYCLYFRV